MLLKSILQFKNKTHNKHSKLLSIQYFLSSYKKYDLELEIKTSHLEGGEKQVIQ